MTDYHRHDIIRSGPTRQLNNSDDYYPKTDDPRHFSKIHFSRKLNNNETQRRRWLLTCRNCGGGDRDGVAIYRPFGELRRAKIVLSPVWCSRPTTGVPLAHATMNLVGLDLTTSDRWHQKTTTTAIP
ncbi:hypothetical protein TNCV_2936731 [Trichonephila clavipes]|nr:hypothetical protein TNCV_2936731 [Trichonephila clavipes]